MEMNWAPNGFWSDGNPRFHSLTCYYATGRGTLSGINIIHATHVSLAAFYYPLQPGVSFRNTNCKQRSAVYGVSGVARAEH